MPAQLSREPSRPSVVPLANDSSIQGFAGIEFDPVSFLNDSLPALPPSTPFRLDQAYQKDSFLQEVATQTQVFLTGLNAHNIRFAGALSQLTDEIIRSGSRLAYEVEVLNADANALQECLTDTLRVDIQKFTSAGGNDVSAREEQLNGAASGIDPEFISQLRMLGQVKARLEEVIEVFGKAMNWPLPPSELSLTSSLISLSPPEPGSESNSRDEKGKEFAKKARAEVVEILNHSNGAPDIDAAAAKVNALRSLSAVWKGTAEERARNKFVDSLSKLVDDGRRHLEARSLSQPARETNAAGQPSSSTPGSQSTGQARDRPGIESGSGGGGLFRNLQRLRDEIYLD